MSVVLRHPTRTVARRRVVGELEEALLLLRDADRCRTDADEAVWRLAHGRHRSHRAYLTAVLEVAHGHMVSRDLAERALIAALESPERIGTGRGRSLLSHILREYEWNRAAFESTVRFASGQQQEMVSKHS